MGWDTDEVSRTFCNDEGMYSGITRMHSIGYSREIMLTTLKAAPLADYCDVNSNKVDWGEVLDDLIGE